MDCPECHGSLISPNGPKGETICRDCGLVLDQEQTRQDYASWTPKWISGWDENDSGTLREWLTTLRAVSCQLDLPSFPHREEAARIIKKKSDTLFRSQRFGKNKREAVAALVHLVLRKYNQINPLKEICNKLALDQQLVTKYAWSMKKITNLQRTFSARDYLLKYGWQLTSNAELMKRTEKLLSTIRREISGNPVSLAAGAFYFISKQFRLKPSRDEIANAFHISSRTVYSNERRINKLLSMKVSTGLDLPWEIPPYYVGAPPFPHR